MNEKYLMGRWMVEPRWLQTAAGAIASEIWTPTSKPTARTLDSVDDNGIGTVMLQGPLSKRENHLGGTSMIKGRRALMRMERNQQVIGVLLHVDSPGGTVAGAFDLANTVAGMSKPVLTFAEDRMTSAALLIGTQAGHVSANENAQVGSIGVVTEVMDTSGFYNEQGVVVHVVSTGKYKGAFADGTEITDEQLEYLQERVNRINDLFVGALVAGRDMSEDRVRALADGRVWIGEDARDQGLVDVIETHGEAYTRLLHEAQKQQQK